MRIALDCRIAHYTRGGTAVYTERLVDALLRLPQAAAHRWLILEAGKAGASPWDRLPAGSSRGRLWTPSHHRWEQALLPVELGWRSIDVLHSPDYIPPFRRRCRSVITVHDLAFLRWPELLTPASRAYFNGQIDRAVRSADRIIAVSHATKADLMELLHVPAEKIDVVHEAAGPGLTPLHRSVVEGWLDRNGLPRDYVLFVGTFEPRKNLPRLVAAFGLLRERGYEGKLLLAGSPGWLAEPLFEEIERRRLGAEVVQREITAENLPYLYNGARLLAFPSLYEGFGLPVLQAMACGTPVVTASSSSLPEVAGDAALLVDPEDVQALADAMARVIGDAALSASLRNQGPARAAQFSWERTAVETLAVYERAAGS